METLLDLLYSMPVLGSREAVRWTDGYRVRIVTYAALHNAIVAFAAYLDRKGMVAGDRVLIWGENRPEWLIVFWACVAKGVEVVPVDFRFSVDLVKRIQLESRPKFMACGDEVAANCIALESISFSQIAQLPPATDLQPHTLTPDSIVEIVYTSGTTGEPKGVVHRHRNICANLRPFRKEIDRYKRWTAPIQPIRVLNLLPLSHMFGQFQGLFIPVLLEGSVAFMNDLHSGTIIRTIHDHHVSVVASVPRVLENLRNEVARQFKIPEPPGGKGWIGVAKKLWRYRTIHARFGWKFWAFVVGGARVDPEIEKFWRRLGFAVIQGYGLTETSPVVAVNHPFKTRLGSLGKVVEGQDVRIASDGEILVRGESVVTQNGEWLHTGDLGEIDADGRLYYRGRKKDLIVTPEGLNVYPDDVESVLNEFPEIRESAVVAVRDHVHAALILKEPRSCPVPEEENKPVDVESIVQMANHRLEAHQRIRSWSIWPEEDFPRTASTMKVKRAEIASAVASVPARAPSVNGEAGMRTSTLRSPDTPDLSALSSLERVELLADLEHRHGIDLDEEAFSRLTSTAELEQWIRNPPSPLPSSNISRWPLRLFVRAARTSFQHVVVLPLFRHYFKVQVSGLENLADVEPPVIFVANHASHLDTVAILAGLPYTWRRRLAPAMSQDHFRAYFDSKSSAQSDVWLQRFEYVLARGLFNTYPLPQQMSGVRQALSYTADLVNRGYCPLVFPEGMRTTDGSLLPFKPGIGMMAVRLKVPVVPIRLEGLFDIYSVHHHWPKRGPIRLNIGRALNFSSETAYQNAARLVEQAFRTGV